MNATGILSNKSFNTRMLNEFMISISICKQIMIVVMQLMDEECRGSC